MTRNKVMAGFTALLVGAALTGCTTTPLPDGSDLPTAISYNTGSCFGPCPIYVVTVRADGTATWEGKENVAFKGVRQFNVSDEQYRAFARKLSTVRPKGTRAIVPGSPDCGPIATDQSTARIWWEGASGTDALTYHYGCTRSANRQMVESIRTAPALLPIQEFIAAPVPTQP